MIFSMRKGYAMDSATVTASFKKNSWIPQAKRNFFFSPFQNLLLWESNDLERRKVLVSSYIFLFWVKQLLKGMIEFPPLFFLSWLLLRTKQQVLIIHNFQLVFLLLSGRRRWKWEDKVELLKIWNLKNSLARWVFIPFGNDYKEMTIFWSLNIISHWLMVFMSSPLVPKSGNWDTNVENVDFQKWADLVGPWFRPFRSRLGPKGGISRV